MRKRTTKKEPWHEAWMELATRLDGRMELGRGDRPKRILFPIDPWLVVLDSYTTSNGHSSQKFTRIRALYQATDDFRFRLYRRSIFSGIGKFFGMQDIEVGQPQIDEDWIIKANSLGRIQSLMAQPEIPRALATLRSGRLDVNPLRGRNKAPGRMVLAYQTSGTLRDLPKLEAAVTLVRHVLQRLSRLGSAAREAVPVEP